ncbi:MAG: site-specific integrase [Prosthecobacter sp.]|nr:site-specific integrase [Prosthecobacter sp.]
MGNTVAGVEQGRVTTVSWRADASSLYAPNGCRKYLNHAERQRALAAMSLLKFDQALFALTLAWTGARVSEILALTPSSFQLEGGTVAIQTLKRRKHSVREVPIPPELMTQLDRTFGIALAQRNSESAHRRLWPWCRSTAWRIIKRVMHQAGIIGSHACPRGLRHAFGVGTLQAHVPITLVQRWLGHARLSTTAIYVDASGPEETAFAKRFWEAA